jgi:hypothetical protein
MVNLMILFEAKPKIHLEKSDLQILNAYLRSYDMHISDLPTSGKGYSAALNSIYKRIKDVLTSECASLHATPLAIQIAPLDPSASERPYFDPLWVSDRMVGSLPMSPIAWETVLQSVATSGPLQTIIACVEVLPYSNSEVLYTMRALGGATAGSGNMSLLQTLPHAILENIARPGTHHKV